jgi:hypothetical protein
MVLFLFVILMRRQATHRMLLIIIGIQTGDAVLNMPAHACHNRTNPDIGEIGAISGKCNVK